MMKMLIHLTLCLAFAACSVHAAWGGDVVRDTLELSKEFQARPASLIEGKVSGVQVLSSNGSVNGDLFVHIRGLNSVRSDSQPLWIVDGAPTIGMFDLNPYDIESIEVLKDVSATAIYGLKGANGVILINTKRQKQDGLKVDWHSNAAVSSPFSTINESRTALSHNHSLSLSSVNGQSLFNLSGYWRTDNDVLRRNGNNSGLVNVLYETRANPVVWFSTNTMLSAGGAEEPGYLYEDYDNDTNMWRIFNTSSLSLNFTKTFSFKLNLGVDYKNNTSFVWFGTGTDRGAAANGEACISGMSFIRYHAAPTMSWYRYFGKGRLDLSAGVSANGDYDRTNVMRGTDFFSHELRARGLNIHASKTVIDNHAINYSSYGAYLKGGYSFGEMAGLDAMLRLDRTPVFDDAPVLHYAVNAFWKPLDYLKVSAGYGVGGVEQMTDYAGFSSFVTGTFTEVDPDLAYYYKGLNRVRTSELNAGAQLSLMHGMLNLATKFYSRLTDDAFNAYCFGRKTADSYLWRYADRTPYFDETSSFGSTGVEFDADAKLLNRDNLNWSLGCNMAWNDVAGILGGLTSVLKAGRFVLEAELDGADLSGMADFFKLGKLNAGWNLNPTFLPHVRGMRLSLSGRNLLLFCADKDKNPFLARSVVAGVSITL